MHVQPADIGWPTGNGKKLSCSQACCHAWLQLSFFPFPVGPSMSAGCIQYKLFILKHKSYFNVNKRLSLTRWTTLYTYALHLSSQQRHSDTAGYHSNT